MIFSGIEEMISVAVKPGAITLIRIPSHGSQDWKGYHPFHITETFDAQIDLALLDIKLPDMEARPNLKVTVFSGFAIEGPARKILDAGAQDFIQKPFSLATLSEKLKKVLEGK